MLCVKNIFSINLINVVAGSNFLIMFVLAFRLLLEYNGITGAINLYYNRKLDCGFIVKVKARKYVF